MHPDDLSALVRAMEQGRPDTRHPFFQVDLQQIQRIADEALETKLRAREQHDRRECREIAREVCAEELRKLHEAISKFVPGEDIKKLIVEALSDVGLRAETLDQQRDTRRHVERLFDDQQRRFKITKNFGEELIKGLAAQLIGILMLFLAYLGFAKGGGH